MAFNRIFPPVRLLWIFLATLGAYGAFFLQGEGALALVVVPLVAVFSDLLLQRIRFPTVRFPDAAIATGLFVALLLPPIAPVYLTGVAAFAAIVARHALRYRGHPWFNPALLGVLTGSLVLGLAPAWWVGIGPLGEYLVIVLGIALIARDRTSWALPVVFLLAYGAIAVVQHAIVGTSTDPRVLLLLSIDPSTLFFALFMVAEPRSAPRAENERILYAGLIGVGTALIMTVLPSLAVFAALALGNVLTLALRRSRAVEQARATLASGRATEPGAKGRRTKRHMVVAKPRPATKAPERWTISHRIATGFFLLIVLSAVALSAPTSTTSAPILRVSSPGISGGGSIGTPPPTTGTGGSSGASVAASNCQTDSSSIPAATLTQLHKVLGPSVILSYDSSTGVTVFYDPVNHVTVTEYDLYEDYGFAEFNGDDYAVNGCVP